MEIKPGFTQTEEVVIPRDWVLKRVSDIAITVASGKSRVDTKFSEYPVYGSTGIIGWSIKSDYSGKSILVARVGVNAGKLNVVDGAYGVTDNTIIVRIDESCDLDFFWRQLEAKHLNSMVFGSGQPLITGTQIKNLLMSLPPTKEEQEAIATALISADALIESLEKLIAKKRLIKQGTMQELLTGKKRLPGLDGKWESRPLRKFVRQFIVPMRDKPKHFTGNIPWCRIEDFDGIYLTGSKSGQCVDIDTVHSMNLKVYPTGTLLVSCSADLGRCAIVTRPLVSNQTFIGLVMDDATSSNLFFYYFMTSLAEDLNNMSSGTTISYLSREQFEEYIVSVPVDKEEQVAIAMILFDMDSEITMLGTRLDKVRQLKLGMMQELLTGRIRLV
jgi:type I restriction enzyme S subunit